MKFVRQFCFNHICYYCVWFFSVILGHLKRQKIGIFDDFVMVFVRGIVRGGERVFVGAQKQKFALTRQILVG